MASSYDQAMALAAIVSALSDAANAGASWWNAYSAAQSTGNGAEAVRILLM